MLIDEGLELLDERQCRELLAAGSIGRVGITIAGLPVIMPVNYSMLDGDIVFRTGAGSKLHAASNHAVIAFEVDAYDTELEAGWSVLAIGHCATIDDPQQRDAAAGVSRPPWAQGRRDHYVRLQPELLTGRRISAL
jgi:nitroimidazol reductase NimA-like FMN-containing flavoprotein (pyridoxamine 5'-phosphate oxidase superfamily)